MTRLPNALSTTALHPDHSQSFWTVQNNREQSGTPRLSSPTSQDLPRPIPVLSRLSYDFTRPPPTIKIGKGRLSGRLSVTGALSKLPEWNRKFICANVTTCAVLQRVQCYDVCRTDLSMPFYILPLPLLSVDHALNRHPMKICKYMHTMYIQIQFSIRHPKERMHNILLSAISLQSIKGYLINCPAN